MVTTTPGRPCSLCSHPEIGRIDECAAMPLDQVVDAFGVSRSALHRHRKHAVERRGPAPPPAPPPAWARPAPVVSLTSGAHGPTAPVSSGAPVGAVDAKAVAAETLLSLRRALSEAPSEDVPTIANAITSASRLLARLSGELEITEAQIVRSVPFRRLMDRLDGVLSRHPAAAKEWAEALAEES